MDTGGLILVALAIAVGLVGIIVPILPGALLVLAAIAVWAFVDHTTTAWVTLGIAVLLIGASTVIKYTWPMRRMRDAEISKKTLAIGAVLGIIGFFVVPVLGLVLGFVLGVYVAELAARARRAAGLGVDIARPQRCCVVGRYRTGRRAGCDGGVGRRGTHLSDFGALRRGQRVLTRRNHGLPEQCSAQGRNLLVGDTGRTEVTRYRAVLLDDGFQRGIEVLLAHAQHIIGEPRFGVFARIIG